MPVAAFGQFQGVPLTNAELTLLGWYLTDGNINKRTNALTIVQSVNSPYLEEIESTLEACGFKWNVSRVPASSSQFVGAADRLHYRVSKGKPRRDRKHLRGWGALGEYVGKEIADPLMSCTREQFAVLLDAIYHGDGLKRTAESVYWTVQTKDICSGNKKFADRLQMMAVLRGYRCSIAVHNNKNSKNPMYVLHIKDSAVRHVPGANQPGRKGLKRIAASGTEGVWCVSNALGTIITRHRGHVSVVGNCGRGFRLHDGKADCLVLDFGNNIKRHGPVDEIVAGHRPKPSTDGKAKTKTCPECKTELPLAATTCPDCNYEYPPAERPLASHDEKAADDAVLSGGPPPEHDVFGVGYHVHLKRGAPVGHPPTMRVEYHVDMTTTFREWVCIQHDGFAGGKARAWWKARSNDPFPESVLHAVQIAKAGGLAEPQRIAVVKKSKDDMERVIVRVLGPIPPATGIAAGRMPGDEEDDDWSDPPVPAGWAEEEIPF